MFFPGKPERDIRTEENRVRATRGRSPVTRHLREVRGVEGKADQAATDETGDGDGHDPGEDEEADSLPVDGAESAVAETDTDGGTSDAHGSRDGERVLGEEEDSDSGTHLHRAATRRRVVGKLVAHDCELCQ